MSNLIPISLSPGSKIMVFVDGENLAIRCGALLNGANAPAHVTYEKDIYVWSNFLNMALRPDRWEIIRKYYYTSVQGDEAKVENVEENLLSLGIEAPRIFKKKRGHRSKRVDISLATDMLSHAHKKNFDAAVLVAGDEDYVPLLQAVMNEGRRVYVWSISAGTSPALRRQSDYYFDLSDVLTLEENAGLWNKVFHAHG